MSYTYQFRFYQPAGRIERDRVLDLLAALLAPGGRILDYERDYEFVRVQPGATVTPTDMVANDGTCQVRFAVPGLAECYLQVYEPEVMGAQVALAIDEAIFESSPDMCAGMLLDLSKAISTHLSPLFGWGDHELALERLESTLAFDRIGALAWANLFSPSLADHLVLDPLRRAPGYQMQDLPQGFLYLLAPTPLAPPAAGTLSYLRQALPGVAISQW